MRQVSESNPAWLSAAVDAANAAEALAMSFFQTDIQVETKDDNSPVTEADRACERAIRSVLSARFPDHAIVGEEYGQHGQSRHVWLIDPIDGTRSFIRGLPFWSIQIALMVDDELVVGVSSAPAFGERAHAMVGCGAHLNDQPMAVRSVEHLSESDVSFGNIRSLAKSPQWPWLGRVIERAARTRGYGDFYSYHRLAMGQQDVVIESDVNVLDIAALTVIVREAGGEITDLQGRPIDADTTSVLAACPGLHAQLLKELVSS